MSGSMRKGKSLAYAAAYGVLPVSSSMYSCSGKMDLSHLQRAMRELSAAPMRPVFDYSEIIEDYINFSVEKKQNKLLLLL